MAQTPRERPVSGAQPDHGKQPKTPDKRALLIGVRTYPQIPEGYGGPLAGCHNDVAGIREVLLERGFHDANIRVLVDGVAGCDCPFCQQAGNDALPTREGISSAVRELTAATGPDDVVVIYYSGHGSEFAGRDLHAGQRFQSIVPHDSGRGDQQNRDIADREIEGWIRAIHRRTPYLTLIFDCCHSGGMADLRGDASTGPDAARQVKPDERTETRAYAPALIELQQSSEPSEGSDQPASDDSLRGPTGWLRGTDRTAIVLSASAAKELSSETAEEGRKQGLFTTHLRRALRGRDTSGLTWADVFPEIADGVTAENLSQHPRREGSSPIFERGEIDPTDVYPPDVVELEKLAVVIGIDYDREAAGQADDTTPGFPTLETPKSDALEVARVLSEVQGYEIVGLSRRSPGPLLNEKATRRRIHKVINRLITVKARARREVAVVIYFAGHGVVRTGDDGEQAGYLVPWDANAEDPATWLPMKDFRDHLVDGIRDAERLEQLGMKKPLARLTSRHLLLVLDCCFGGALSFDFFRGGGTPDRPIYYSEYKRFVEGSAWQMLTSASYNQQAMDRNPGDPEQPYSPFAQAVIDGLTTAEADSLRSGSRSDQIITAAELHQYVDARLQALGVDIQTPGLMALRPLKGQFIFHVPGFKPSPLPDPPLDPAANPWQGDDAYNEDPELFRGRELATLELLDRFLSPRLGDSRDAPRPALAVVGGSGSGKASLVRAGLLPVLADPVAGRQRLLSWARREGLRQFLVSREDLKQMRKWAADLELDVAPLEDDLAADDEARAAKAQTVADRIREWARSTGVGGFDASASGTGQVQSQIQMSHLGMPSFTASSDDGEDRAWLKRLGVLDLLDRPLELIERLRLWLATGGLADFFSVSDRAVTGLVGRWRVITELADARPSDDSDKRGVLLWIAGLDKRIDEVFGDAWNEFAAGERARTVATVGPTCARERLLDARDAGGQKLWRLHGVRGPSRSELLDVALGPAAARALVFEPSSLAESLVAEVEKAPAPLPLLSVALADAYQRAWRRRKDADRLLTDKDLDPGGIAGLFAQRAEAVTQRLVAEDSSLETTIRDLFLRAVSLAGERPASRKIPWRQLELADPAEHQRLDESVLPAFLEARLMVAGETGLELAMPGLIDAWDRLDGWIRHATQESADLHALWRRALEWEASGCDRGKLWSADDAVRRMLGLPGLCRLERAFVVASEMERRLGAAGALAALPNLAGEWSRGALLAAEAAALAIDTAEVVRELLEEPWLADRSSPRDAEPAAAAAKLATEARDLSRWAAEQALHDALAATPFSVPLAIPEGGQITALGFDDERRLRVRITGPDEGDADHVYAWSLADLTAPPDLLSGAKTPERGAGQALAKSLPFGFAKEFPAVSAPSLPPAPPGPRVRAGHDKAIRYFAPALVDVLPKLGHFSKAPRVLLGHRGVPAFLAFSKPLTVKPSAEQERYWLASAANPTRGAELRLWPIRARGRLPAQPESMLDKKLEDVVPRPDPPRKTSLWQIEPVTDSSFVLRHRETGDEQTIEFYGSAKERPAPPKSDNKPATSPSLPAIGPLPALRLPPPPPPPPRPPWLAGSEPAAPKFHFDPGGQWLAGVSEIGEAWLWSLPDAALRWSADGGVTCLAFNPVADKATLMAAGTDSGPLWLISRELTASRLEHGPQGRASAIDFSPDGRRLAVGNLDGTVCLWRPDPDRRAPPVVLRSESHEGFAVSSLAFVREGRCLAVERRAVYDFSRTRIDVYRLDLDELMLLARGHAGRALEPGDLPSELRYDPFSQHPTETEVRTQKQCYLAALAAPTTAPREKKT